MAYRWKAISIFHRGTMKERLDDMYPEHKERVFILNPEDIQIGKRLFVECEGNFMRSMMTSPIVSFKERGGRLKFRTANSVYILEQLKKE